MTSVQELRLPMMGVLAAVLASTLFYSSFSLNHDSGWYLVATRMFMDGSILYRDILEINPPLAFYLTVPALLISDLTGLRPTTAFFLYVSMLGGVSTLWVHCLMRRTPLGATVRLLVVACAFVGCFLIAMQDFGQREHLLLIFAMPYFVFLFFQQEFRGLTYFEQAALGLVAFLGLGLKPYFLLIPAGIVLFRLFRNRSIRDLLGVANLTLAGALVAYLGFITTMHPLYLEQIVPAASLIYSAYGSHPLTIFFRLEIFGLIAVVALALLCRKELDGTSYAVLGGLVGATASYLVQFKGWNYHVIPAAFFVFLSAIWITYQAISLVRRHVLLGILALTAGALSLGVQLAEGPYLSRTTRGFGSFVERPGTPVLVLSSNVWASFPFINDTDARWTSSYSAQWLLPGAVSLQERTDCDLEPELCDSYRGVISIARERIVEDMLRERPELVFVDDRESKSHFNGVEFDYRNFLLEDVRFVEIWRDYHRIDRAGEYEVWALAQKAASGE